MTAFSSLSGAGLLLLRPCCLFSSLRTAAALQTHRRSFHASSRLMMTTSFGEVRLWCGPTTTIQAEELSETLMEIGAMSVDCSDAEVGTAAESPILSSSSYRECASTWRSSKVTALVAAGDEDRLLESLAVVYSAEEVASLRPERSLLPDMDWLEEQERLRPPVYIAGLRISLPWHEPDPKATLELSIEGGAAFGTGEHQTTRMCVEWLATQPLEGKRVLDYGCGSGILSLAAIAFGAESAPGVDIDPLAVATARRNAVSNGLSQAEFYLPAGASDEAPLPPDLVFPVVVANILLGPLIDLRATITDRVERGGSLAVAGIRTGQEEQVVAAYAADFVGAEVLRNMDDWLLVVFTDRR